MRAWDRVRVKNGFDLDARGASEVSAEAETLVSSPVCDGASSASCV